MIDMNDEKHSRLSAMEKYKENLLKNELRNREKFRQIRDEARTRRKTSKDSML